MRLARFWFLARGKRVDVTSLVGDSAHVSALAVMLTLHIDHGIRAGEAFLITGRYLPTEPQAA